MREAKSSTTFLICLAAFSTACAALAAAIYCQQPGFDTTVQRSLVAVICYTLTIGVLAPLGIFLVRVFKGFKRVPIPPRVLPRRHHPRQPPSTPAPTSARLGNLQWKPANAVARQPDSVIRKVA
jgi:hypothetical protein